MTILMLWPLSQNDIVLDLLCQFTVLMFFWAILDVELSQMKFWITLFISSIALLGVLTTLETYITGANAKLLSTVIFYFSDNFHCFHIFSVAFSVKILCWKLYLMGITYI